MPIRRATPLSTLYAEVADYDLVLIPDNPLASAVNRRVETPTFGTFATTPRRLAAGRREQAEDRLAFLEVIEGTDHAWKAVAYAVGNVLQCWEHEGDRAAIFEYPAYVDGTTEAVVDALADLRTTSGQLSTYDVAEDPTLPDDPAVAVVGFDQLTPLERSIVPPDADHYSLFTEETVEPPEFHVFDSSADVVDALMDTVDAESAERVAVVLDESSRYASLVEAALDAADVPHYGGPGFVDDPDHRAVLRLLRVAHRGSDTTVADVRPICARANADVPVDHEHERLDRVDLAAVAWIADFCERVDASADPDAPVDSDAPDAIPTFDDALTTYETRTDAALEAFREELASLGLLDAPVTQSNVDDLAFYLQTYDVPIERDREGVLLADATSSGYVDRPVVFSVGLDEGWIHAAPRRPWVDADAQFDRHLRRFQLLLQSGTEQYCLVQDTAGGQPVTPCPYLGELLDGAFERFSDLASTHHTRPSADYDEAGFERDPSHVSSVVPSTIDTISQSSLNGYVNSPRDYLFGRLLDGPDRDYFREGNLFHDFAEFAVANPEMIDEDTVAETVDLMLAEAGSFFSGDEAPLRRRTYRIGLETIVAFLEEHPPETEDFLTPSSGWGTNAVAEHFGASVDSPLTERWFENHAVRAKGKIDLARAPDHLVDYKSGYKKSAYRVVESATIDPPDDTPNFQAALYLSHFRTEQPDTKIEFTFLHFLETIDDVIAGEEPAATLDDATTTVTYHPESFDAYVASRTAYGELLDGYNDCVATFEDLGYPAYREIVADLTFPDTTDREELRDSTFASDFAGQVDAATADEVDAEKGCDQAIRALNGVRKRAFFQEDLDAFEEFAADCIEVINDRRAGEERFPVEGPGGEPNYRRVDHRDLLLGGER